MTAAVYRVASRGDEWFVFHDGNEAGPYATKEAAFEAAVPTASLALAEGYSVELYVEAGTKEPLTQAM